MISPRFMLLIPTSCKIRKRDLIPKSRVAYESPLRNGPRIHDQRFKMSCLINDSFSSQIFLSLLANQRREICINTFVGPTHELTKQPKKREIKSFSSSGLHEKHACSILRFHTINEALCKIDPICKARQEKS